MRVAIIVLIKEDSRCRFEFWNPWGQVLECLNTECLKRSKFRPKPHVYCHQFLRNLIICFGTSGATVTVYMNCLPKINFSLLECSSCHFFPAVSVIFYLYAGSFYLHVFLLGRRLFSESQYRSSNAILPCVRWSVNMIIRSHTLSFIEAFMLNKASKASSIERMVLSNDNTKCVA